MMYETSYGTKYELEFRRGKYAKGNSLAIQVMCRELDEEYFLPYCMLTVNLPDIILSSDGSKDLPHNRAFLNINNYGTEKLYEMLIENGYMTITRTTAQSGFCEYPLVVFNEEWLNTLKPI